jgi:hypothetical protein
MSGQRNLIEFLDDPSQPSLYSALPVGIARHPTLSPQAVRVAGYIWSHKEKFRQSASGIAEAIGMHRDTVARALDELQAHGWLVRYIYTKPGNRKPSYEKWYVQRRNVPLTPEQVAHLAGEPAENISRFSDDAVGSVGRGCLQEQQIPAGSVGNIGIEKKYKVSNTGEAAQTGQRRNGSNPVGSEAEPHPLPSKGEKPQERLNTTEVNYHPFDADEVPTSSGLYSFGQSAFAAEPPRPQAESDFALSLLTEAIRASESGKVPAKSSSEIMQVPPRVAESLILAAVSSGELVLTDGEYGKDILLA